MKKAVKFFSALISMVTITVLGLMTFAYVSIPNKIYATQDNFTKKSIIYSFEKEVKEVNGNISEVTEDNEEYDINIKLLKSIPIKTSSVTVTKRDYVVVGGEAFGIKFYTDGVLIVDSRDVTTTSGNVNPAKKAGLKSGDIITKVNGKKVYQNIDVAKEIEKSNGENLKIEFLRNGKTLSTELVPVLSDIDGKYKIGLWIRDSTAGIGTMTFYDPKTKIFAGLGHAICDVDTQEIMPLLDGDAVGASIKGCYKGEKGITGELCGVLKNNKIGELLLNDETGLYGIAGNNIFSSELTPVALKGEIVTGKAQIISTTDDGEPKSYDIEIIKINTKSKDKSMIIKVTDKELISKTGGIVQGMSGSPILQNGFLVGAVTHVMVNDPTRGYAIFAETMLETSQKVYGSTIKKAS